MTDCTGENAVTLLPRWSEISFSFPCSVSLCFFLTFFSPKAIWTVEVCICYKLENTAVNVCVLKPASASFMNPIIQNLTHKWLTYGDVSKHYLSWHQAGTLEKPVLKKNPYSLGIFITTKRKRPNQETWLHAL